MARKIIFQAAYLTTLFRRKFQFDVFYLLNEFLQNNINTFCLWLLFCIWQTINSDTKSLVMKNHIYIYTFAVPKSSQSRRILPEQEKSSGYGCIIDTVSSVTPWPIRKNECTKAMYDPPLVTPFVRYCSRVGVYPLLNHFASVKNASNMSIHCKNLKHYLLPYTMNMNETN